VKAFDALNHNPTNALRIHQNTLSEPRIPNRNAPPTAGAACDVPHHITQRRDNRQTEFQTDVDRFFYLDLLCRKPHEHDLSTLGRRPMPNHVHVIAVLVRTDAMAKTLGQSGGQSGKGSITKAAGA